MRKILIVDDDPIIREMMQDILKFEDYPTCVVRNGREALELLRSSENYLVFLDLMMPVLDGQEVCETLDAEPEVRKRHVIVLMSAMDKLVEFADLNVDARMPKPFSVDDLMEVVEPYMK